MIYVNIRRLEITVLPFKTRLQTETIELSHAGIVKIYKHHQLYLYQISRLPVKEISSLKQPSQLTVLFFFGLHGLSLS